MKTFTLTRRAVNRLFTRIPRRWGLGQALRLRRSIDAWFRSGSGRAPRTMRDAIRSLQSLVPRQPAASPTQSQAPPQALRQPVFQQRLAQSNGASATSTNRRSGVNSAPGRAGAFIGSSRGFFPNSAPDNRRQSSAQPAITGSVVAAQPSNDVSRSSWLERAASARRLASPGLAASPALSPSPGRPALPARIERSMRMNLRANESPAESMMPQEASMMSDQATRANLGPERVRFRRNLLDAVRRDLSQRAGMRFVSELRDRVLTLPGRRQTGSAAVDRLPGESSFDQTKPIAESSSQGLPSAMPRGEIPFETSVPDQRHFQSSDWINEFQKRREAATNSRPFGMLPRIR